MHSGMALRMAQELKLNCEPEFRDDNDDFDRKKCSWIERETRRRVWWCCFMLDRYSAAAADRASIINERECKTYLPCQEFIWDSVQRKDENPLDDTEHSDFEIALMSSSNDFVPGMVLSSPFAYLIFLCKIFGKVAEYSKLVRAEKRRRIIYHDIDLDEQKRRLDASLKDWLMSLPEWAKNLNPVFREGAPSQYPQPWNIIYLRKFS